MFTIILNRLINEYKDKDSYEDRDIYLFLLYVKKEYEITTTSSVAEFLVEITQDYTIKGKLIGCPLIKKILDHLRIMMDKETQFLKDTFDDYKLIIEPNDLEM